MPDFTTLNITVPQGSSTHGNPHLLCTPPTSLNIIVFFLANYFAHAATVLTRPGASAVEQFAVILLALLFPGSGIIRACHIIHTFLFTPLFRKLLRLFKRPMQKEDARDCVQDELTTAARAGALCTLVRTEKWRPQLWTRNKELAEIGGCVVVRKTAPDSEHRFGHEADDIGLSTLGYTPSNFLELSNILYGRTMIGSSSTSPQGDLDQRAAPDLSHPQPIENSAIVRPQPCLLQVTAPSWFDDYEQQDYAVHHPMSVHGRVGLSRTEDSGYALVLLPSNARVISDFPTIGHKPSSKVVISKSYSIGKAAIAIFQFVFAVLTLVRSSEGNQIQLYGYSSFSLTVTPYAVMSLVNLIANLFCPTYASLYMVRNSVMDEAESRLGKSFEGIVGRLQPIPETLAEEMGQPESKKIAPNKLRRWLANRKGLSEEQWLAVTRQKLESPRNFSWLILASILGFPEKHNSESEHPNVATPISNPADWEIRSRDNYTGDDIDTLPVIKVPACENFDTSNETSDLDERLSQLTLAMFVPVLILSPYIVIGCLSHFHPGTQSTTARRVWTMTWLAFGQLFTSNGLLVPFFIEMTAKKFKTMTAFTVMTGFSLLGLLVFAVPALGGFVVVGQMLREYGYCLRLY